MPIHFSKEERLFTLTTKNTRYVFGVSKERYLVHHFYGSKRESFDLYKPCCYSFSPYQQEFGNTWSPDVFPQEYSFFGSGDFRTAALKLKGADGTGVTDFSYVSYRYLQGRKEIEGLPFASADGEKTLEIKLSDRVTGCELFLYYTVFYEEDVISRYMLLRNRGNAPVKLEKCMSFTLDLPGLDYDMVSLYGAHYDERHLQRTPLHYGMQSIYSRRGASSHQFNPFFALCDKKATETKGKVYGFNFVYSGSFLDEVEVDQTEHTRVQVGLGEENFGYTLLPGEEFASPEAILTFSDKGFGQMTRSLHDFTRNRILPKEAVQKPHPVVLNTWEACYFNIDEDKLVEFAKESAKAGFDMLVMDDGWFGKRNNDRAGLGDWQANPEKFKNGLKAFAEKVKEAGVSFGIWVEPEMVNPDSDLYRAHPEWCLCVPQREPLVSREQLVLDMSNPTVVEFLKESFLETFRGVPIDYFKWDMNRHLCHIGSSALPADRQDEVPFRYMKGVYELLQWFKDQFPQAIIETCSGGGGRYDLGMMHYGFQIWTSDNTNPYSRLWMQRGSLIAYPAATMSCHVSNPGENLRSLDFRYKVAVGGMLGYELNILRMSEAIKAEMSREVGEYKSFEHLMRLGDYYSLVSPFEEDYAAYYYTDKARKEFLLSVVEKGQTVSRPTKPLKIREAKSDKTYVDLLTGSKYDGTELRAGLILALTGEKDTASLLHLVEE